MFRLRGLLGFFLASAVSIVAACGDVPAPTVLQPLDLAPSEMDTEPFDRNRILDTAAMTDISTARLDAIAIQSFFAKTPYSRPTFLETYQSNGVRASDAVVAASTRYRINPLVFLVFTEIMQGLVGARTYRFPPERVEYIFGCGCYAPDQCEPELAGYDRQLNCLGQALRTGLDEIRLNERTAAGWGPDVASTTVDNIKVTPANEATAVLYARLGRVNEGRDSGTWAFWKVWQLYAGTFGYSSPSEQTQEGGWIGEACTSNAACSAIPDGICADNFPDGLCTQKCNGACEASSSHPEAFCASFPDGGYCLTICNPEAPSCRAGYQCVNAVGMISGVSQHVCSPTNG